jgi:hypothetical protein
MVRVIVFAFRLDVNKTQVFFERLNALKQFFFAHFCCLLIIEFELRKGYAGFMHLPDPSYVSFVTAVITSVTALTGLAKVFLEKKAKSLHAEASKKTLTPNFIKCGVHLSI